MYNAVPSEVFSHTLKHIEDSLEHKPRNAILILENPEQDSLVQHSKYFSIIVKKKRLVSWFNVYIYKSVVSQ